MELKFDLTNLSASSTSPESNSATWNYPVAQSRKTPTNRDKRELIELSKVPQYAGWIA